MPDWVGVSRKTVKNYSDNKLHSKLLENKTLSNKY